MAVCLDDLKELENQPKKKASSLCERLAESNALGLNLCGEAQREIERLKNVVAQQQERLSESRAEQLSVLLASVRIKLADLSLFEPDFEDIEEHNEKLAQLQESLTVNSYGATLLELAYDTRECRSRMEALEDPLLKTALPTEILKRFNILNVAIKQEANCFGSNFLHTTVTIEASGTDKTIKALERWVAQNFSQF